MLKWLRKYNTYILVVGGCLLMVAFLLGQSLQDLTQRGILGGKVMRVNGQKITVEKYQEIGREYHALGELLGGPQMIALAGGGDNVDHWLLLVREAQEGGYIGGPESGNTFIPTIARFIVGQAFASNPFISQEMIDQQTANFTKSIEARIARAGSQSRLSEERVLESLAKLHGIMRMRGQYFSSLRFSDRRLISGVKDLSDGVEVEFVLVPADRETAGIPEPDEAAIQAQFNRFKDTPAGGGDYGIGYKLPARAKVTWLEINRKAITDAVTADPVEVQKAFLRKYPSGKPPEGTSLEDARKAIENEVKTQLVDKILKITDEVVRGSIARTVGKLDTTGGGYKKLPADWASKRPDLVRIAADIIVRVNEATNVVIPQPKVGIRETSWLDSAQLAQLDGIGRAFLRRGNQTETFPQLVFKARELDKDNDFVLQFGVPYADPLTDNSGNKYFIMVLDGRPESAPDSIDEVRAEVIRDIKRMAGFEKLKSMTEAFKQRAIADGLDAIAKAPEGATGEAATPLTVRSITVEKTRTIPQAPDVDVESMRDAVRAVASKLDPMTDMKTVDAAARTVVTPIQKSLSLFVGRIKALTPMTVERFRGLQQGMINRMSSTEMPREEANDPFSLSNMEKRLKVEYLDGRKTAEERANEAPKPAAS